MSTLTAATKETLNDLKANGNELMDRFNEAGECVSKKATEAMRDARRSLYRMQDSTEEAMRETRHTIQKNPIGSVALATGVGACLGVLVGYFWRSQRD